MTQAPSIDKLDKNFAPVEVADGQHWFDIRDLGVEGRGWNDTDSYYDRLPAHHKPIVREPVWYLQSNSAGMCVRFVTDATTISAKWKLRSDTLAMPHMPATGVSGLDLYAKVKGKWVWAGVGVPSAAENKAVLVGNLPKGKREFLLYLPLYNGVESVSIGVPQEAKVQRTAPRPGKKQKGFIVYGTSIVQGSCACRSGMGYPEIMSRTLDCHAINLGFSGNGPMEIEIIRFMTELDPAVYVLDCLPNMSGGDMVEQRCEPAVHALRQARPKTPIVLVENIMYQRYPLMRPGTVGHEGKNIALKAAYNRLKKAGVKGLYYVPCKNLLGSDNLGTVDGVHPTDVGFLAQAKEIGKVVKKLL